MSSATAHETIDVAALRVGMFVQLDLGWLSHPFPLPGMEAVFERVLRGGAASFSYSSAVNRVLMSV